MGRSTCNIKPQQKYRLGTPSDRLLGPRGRGTRGGGRGGGLNYIISPDLNLALPLLPQWFIPTPFSHFTKERISLDKENNLYKKH